MSHKAKQPEYCRVIMKDNMQLIVTPDGYILPAQVWTRVTDVMNGRPYAIVKLYVNLDETIDSDKIV